MYSLQILSNKVEIREASQNLLSTIGNDDATDARLNNLDIAVTSNQWRSESTQKNEVHPKNLTSRES